MMRRSTTIVLQFLALTCVAASMLAQPSPPTPPAISAPRHLPPRTQSFGTDGESGTYTYDGSGNIIAIGSDTFLYDAEGRLASAVIRGVPVTYTYDAFGNRTTATGETNCLGQTVCATPITLDPATNRLKTTTVNGSTTNVGYGPAGNITAVSGGNYTYDGTGMMIQATVGTDDRQFVYTADDERIAVRQGQSWTWTVRGPDNKVLREFTSGEPNNSTGFPTPGGQWKKDYIWRDGLLLASTDATGTYHYHLDHLGTPRLITNASTVKIAEHAYYPFGAEIALTPHESTEEAMKFTGHERDIVAGDGHTLDDMHARYYNASFGRFLTRDPVNSNPSDPQSWNRYSYSNNNPLVLLDPDGQSTVTFDPKNKKVTLIDDCGNKVASASASNNPQKNPPTAAALKPGRYNFIDTKSPHTHGTQTSTATQRDSNGDAVQDKSGSDIKVTTLKDSSGGEFGSSGIFRLEPITDNVPSPGTTHEGIGLHSGRDGMFDKAGRSGWEYTTKGCIRTTDAFMSAVVTLAKTDALTHLDVLSQP